VKDKWIVSPQQKFQYFYVENGLFTLFHQIVKRNPNTAEHLLLGYVAALEGNVTTIPLDVILTRRLALRKKRTAVVVEKEETFWESFWETVRTDGFASFYKGWIVATLLASNPAITYVAYERIRLYMLKLKRATSLNAFEAFVAGALSKALATYITFPLMRAKTVLNTWTKLHKGEPMPELHELLVKIVKEEGLFGLFTGVTPQLTKGVLNSALMLMLKEKIDLVVKYLILGK